MTETADRVVLDTDVVSRIMRATLPPELAGRLAGSIVLITFVTVGELLRGAVHADWGSRRLDTLTAWIDATPTIPGDGKAARAWGTITGGALKAGRPLPANDAWIAACCLAHGLPLATLNARDFQQIDGLTLVAGTRS